MGLDIMVLQHIELTEPHEHADDCWGEHHTAYACVGMERSFRGLEGVDREFGAGFFGGRCYTGEQAMDFRAGSYSGYNQWRATLAKFQGLTDKQIWQDPLGHLDTPFYELINFADNEGTIGPEAAADLYEDFVTHRVAYQNYLAREMDGGVLGAYLERYEEWTEAMRIASQEHGMVVFG